jgi:alpha-2-macroglobulin
LTAAAIVRAGFCFQQAASSGVIFTDMKMLAGFLLGLILTLGAVAQDAAALRKERDKLATRGMWKDALEWYHGKLAMVADDQAGADLEQAVRALAGLGAWGDFDGLVEDAVAAHPAHAGLLRAAAAAYRNAPHSGRLIAGEFRRDGGGGFYRGMGMPPGGPADVPEAAAGAPVDTTHRDRVRSLQLLRQAVDAAEEGPKRAACWRAMANAMVDGEAWKMQILTPLDVLPAWGEPGPEGGTEGAPWTKDGPLLHEVPASWEKARSDGERWRFAWAESVRLEPSSAPDAAMTLANFSQSQFGTETLASFGWWRTQDPDSAKGILEMDTLGEDECLAKTSDGVRRFKLPAAHHFIAIYRSLLDARADAGDALTRVFLNRRQYDKAREVLERTIARHGKGEEKHRARLLEQITGRWGRFEPVETVPAGTRPSLPLVFRNATSVRLSASPVDMEKVLADTVAYLEGNPRSLDWERLNPSMIANRLIASSGSKYLGKPAAEWEAALKPRDKHRETRAAVDMPLDRAGAWWVRAKVADGNEFHTLVWIVDSVLVRRAVGDGVRWWLSEAAGGGPVRGAEIRFFGYRVNHLERKLPLARDMEVLTRAFGRVTDADGATLLKPGQWDPDYQWIAMAKAPGRAPAFVGFDAIGSPGERWENGNRDVTYAITDRPLYKPGDTVHLKYYLRDTGYFEPDESRWAGQEGVMVVSDGRGGEAVKVAGLKTDDLGAVEASFVIPADAPLGAWRAAFSIADRIAAVAAFRVEEYRKPEFEVKVEAPAEPVRLGDKFTATVRADYFHGAPVREASVEVTVKRSSLGRRWFPAGRWDWLYGSGAWWGGVEAPWHPSWREWGCVPPPPPWLQGERWTPDELVLKTTVPIGEDGTAKVEVDTALARQVHGDIDASYSIEARVVDASRREERGSGTVIAARRPFEVVVWTNRGHARAGDAVEATIAASTLAGKPVAGAVGTLRLLRLASGPDGRIEEKEAGSWPLKTDAEGRAVQTFTAPATGQYRLAASLARDGGEAIEGAQVLNIHGSGRDKPEDWRFGPLELVADKLEYQPGETVRLRVNSDHENAHVWLFLHIAGGAGREARRIQLDGKSREIEVPVTLKDMPNMFVEGISVHGAKVHTAMRQILLPPVSKLIEVQLEPAAGRVKPGAKSSLRVTLRDADGKPVAGTAVLAVYDKALEAITGGSNVGPIHEAFWNWKNSYHAGSVADSLPHECGNLVRPKATPMQSLGTFGDDCVDPFGGVAMGGGMLQRRGSMWFKGAERNRAMPMAMAEMAMEDGAPMAPLASLRSGDAAVTAGSIDAILAAPAGGSPDGPAVPVVVRKDFADLLKWAGSIQTDAAGTAEIPLEFPDNLTTWKARVWTLGACTQVGEGSTEMVASKELLVRLQAPRFLVERDEAVLSAVVHNDHDAPKTVKVSFESDGGVLGVIAGGTQTVEIAARAEARVDWRVKALAEGKAVVRMKAECGDDGDAVERELPVRVHGMRRQDAWSVTVDPGKDSARIDLEVPAKLRPEASRLTVRFSPSVAGAVVDAIPYLADYPHGCTEQTLNRFVPAVIARRMLRDLNLDLAEIRAKRTNLNPQQLGDAAERAEQWRRWQANPVFDESELDRMVAAGVAKLMSMQLGDGGWGWFSGYGESSYPHTTAVVVHGLLVAKQCGAEVPDPMLQAGVAWLVAYERREAAALQLHVEREALRKAGLKPGGDKYEKHRSDALDAFVRMVLGEAGRDSEPMLAFLHRDRVSLPLYAACLTGLEHHRKGDEARRDEIVAMVSQHLQRDPENQTAFLEFGDSNPWWCWHGSEVETHAWFLKLLAAAKPQDADTRGLVKYLVNNRRHATYWNSTRDTAYAIEAVAAWFKAGGEDAPDMEVEVLVDGKSMRKTRITRDNLFDFDGTVTLSGAAVAPGRHQVELRRTGKGTLYANAYLEVFSLEDRLRSAGLEVKVRRHVSKLVETQQETSTVGSSGLLVNQQGERFRREPLADGAALKSGDRIEVELVIESKNDYEYLIFSDAKAAGFEALDALSGYIPGGGLAAYMEPRDQTVDFFIRSMPRGTHTLRYQLRAEAPGSYKALPATVEAMYAPELRGNSQDLMLRVE